MNIYSSCKHWGGGISNTPFLGFRFPVKVPLYPTKLNLKFTFEIYKILNILEYLQ